MTREPSSASFLNEWINCIPTRLGSTDGHTQLISATWAGRSQASSSTRPGLGCSGNMDPSTHLLPSRDRSSSNLLLFPEAMKGTLKKQPDCPLRLHNLTDIRGLSLHGKINVTLFCSTSCHLGEQFLNSIQI